MERLLAEMRRLVEAYPRYGSERMHQLLVGTGWRVNFKGVHRIWKREQRHVEEAPAMRAVMCDGLAVVCNAVYAEAPRPAPP